MKILLSYILLLVTILLVVLPAAQAEDMSLVRAITLLKSNDKAKAYKILENAFARNQDTNERARMALMLAVAEAKYVKLPRYKYAEFALHNYRNLDTAMALRLTRIVGDGKFNLGDLLNAKRSYQFILSSPGSTNAEKEYATYKLGWIYLNENGPLRAFRLWQNWLEQQNPGELRALITHDLGEAWAESVYSGKNPSLRVKLGNENLERAFYEGILSTLTRRQKAQTGLPLVLNALVDKKMYAAFLNLLLETQNKKLFLRNPCENIHWLNRDGISDVKAENAQMLLAACQKQIQSGRVANRTEKTRHLAEVYMRFPITGADRWPKASSLYSAGKFGKACFEYANTTIEFLRKGDKKEDTPEVLQKTHEACSKIGVQDFSQSQQKAMRELVEVVLTARALATHWQARPQALLDQIIKLAQLHGMQKVAVQQLIASQDIWHETDLSSRMILALGGDSDSVLTMQILEAYLQHGYTPLIIPGLAHVADQFLRNKKNSAVKNLLEKNLPMAKCNRAEEAALWIKYLAVSPGDWQRERILALAQKLEVFQEALLQQPQLLREFLRQNLEDDKANEILLQARKLVLANYLLWAKGIILPRPLTANRVELNQSKLPAVVRGLDLHQDLLLLDEMRREETSYVGVHSKSQRGLHALMEKKIDYVYKLLEKTERHRWSSEFLFRIAQQRFANIVEELGGAVGVLPKEEEVNRRKAKEWAAVVKDWKLE